MTAAAIELTDEQYHRHPALSASGAKLLLPPNCPAIYRYRMDNPPEPKDIFDFGHAAHGLVLGKGMDIEVIQKTAKDGTKADADDMKAVSARDHAEAIRATGKVPLLAKDWATVQEMAEALRANELAAALIADGEAEQKLFWTDEETGVPLRSMLDYYRSGADRLLVMDFKTAVSASPDRFKRSLIDYGYALQAAFYLEAVRANGIAEDAAFLFIVQMKEPPYLVSIFQPDEEALQVGTQLMRQAIAIYQGCTESGVWPGFTTGIEQISVPYWDANRILESA